MKIKSVRIENLRSIKGVTVNFNDYSCLVGPNGAGKSTVLCALNIFFRETSHSAVDLTQLFEEDFHLRSVIEPITITVTFNDLDEEAQDDFKDYYRQGELIVSAVATFDPDTQRAQVKQYGQRTGMSDFAPFFASAGTVADSRDIYNSIKEAYADLPVPGTKAAMVEALRAYEAARPELCSHMPSEDQFYGVSKGSNRLDKYIQWVFIPAIKDANSEDSEGKNTALGKLLARTVRTKTTFADKLKTLLEKTESDYATLLSENQDALDEVSAALKDKLASWTTPNTSLRLIWKAETGKSVRVDEPLAQIIAGEGVFEGQLARFGHGLQRCYLLALLQELSGSSDADGPKLILGFEEPELFQHPPQAQHLSDVLQKLTEGNSQVMVCTHSPYFVSGEFFEDVRLVRKHAVRGCSEVQQVTFEDLASTVAAASGTIPTKREGAIARIHQALQPALNEIFFTPFLVLVEGLEDVAYITTYSA